MWSCLPGEVFQSREDPEADLRHSGKTLTGAGKVTDCLGVIAKTANTVTDR